MTDSVQKIREALAAEPTTGPWYGNFKGVWCDSECHFDRISRSEGTRGKTEWEERNNNYIASVNPTAIAELLQKLDAARLDAERYRFVTGKMFIDAAVDAAKAQQKGKKC